MYQLDIYRFRTSTEYEYKFKGNYGAKGEHREKKQKRTPEYVEKQNQYQRTKTVRHLIKANFKEGDLWTTLTYSDKEGKTIKEISEDLQKFLKNLRYQYKKAGEICKYIYRIEIGSKGGIHIHIILNRIADLDLLIKRLWKHGKTFNELLDDGTYEKLADYIVKQPTDQQKKLLKTFEEDVKKLIRYSCSRNLVRPQPETKVFTRRTMQSIFNNDLKPAAGYYIDRDSIRRGINEYTGYSYLYYQEILIDNGQSSDPVRICECPICHQMTLEYILCDCQRKKKRGNKRISGNNNQKSETRKRIRHVADRVRDQ